MIIETVGLTKYYGKVRGVEDLDLVVREGEVFWLPGTQRRRQDDNDRLILDLIRPTRGTVDCSARRCGTRRRAQSPLGILPGELALWGNLTARDL